jgi:iron complex transport system substrate-binding protein
MAARLIHAPARLFLAALILVVGACTPVLTAPAPTSGPSLATATAAPATAAPPTATPVPAFPVTLTDDEGTEVTIEAEPRKIVSLTPDTTETLFAIGAGSRVVGKVEDIAKFPPEAESIPIVATFAGVDVEKIVDLEPDLVVSAGSGLTQGAAVTQLRSAGIAVLVSYPTTVAGGIASIKRIGQAVGLTDEAATLADRLAARLDDLAVAASSAGTRPRVFYEIDVTGGIFTPPAESIYGEMFRLAGGEPISGDVNYSISLEELIDADPEVILLGDAAYGVTPEAVAAREGWDVMTAVKDGRIVAVDDIIITRPGPRLAEGLLALIEAIHPDLAIPSAAP